MKKKILLLIGIFSIGFTYAQVGINTTAPHGSAALDIAAGTNNDKGLLIPRMTTAQKLAIPTPASGLLVYDTNQKQIYQNSGTPVAPVWVALGFQILANKFFYMPSIAIDVSTVSTGNTLNLYTEYKNQFTGTVPTQFVKSAGAPVTIPFFPVATDLDYYITRYDAGVLDNVSISNTGVMTYDIKATSRYKSFMNVVFVIK